MNKADLEKEEKILGSWGLEVINGLGVQDVYRMYSCCKPGVWGRSVWVDRLEKMRESPVVWPIGWEDTGLSLELLYSEGREGHVRLVD